MGARPSGDRRQDDHDEPPRMARRFAVFLRGVNVGGITVRMADLRELLEELPVRDVRTVLASGNVTCTSELDAAALKAAVEDSLRHRFGYEAWVIVVAHEDLRALAASVPASSPTSAPAPTAGGTGVPVLPELHTYVTLFTGTDERDAFLAEVREFADRPAVLDGGTAVAWFCPKGHSTDVPLAKVLSRTRYAAVSTTRNINTVEKVLRLLE
ncbi:DUF1697 domain-containing protein [Arthrobacter agilis]|uniref:DUF1697 domain-containing protein n=1 Tax=Arthrobacter agilis TaxID=37921 RepID=UPI002365D321|nr:DUF1697 domain-containing protein [Arthrobacter agilis]WDF32164.1 DUF1697 domain-containing protein [Arthrobacter agilis]